MSHVVEDRNLSFASGFPITGETTTVAATTGASEEFTLDPQGFYRIHFETACWFCVGPAATVDATSGTGAKAPSGLIEYFGSPEPLENTPSNPNDTLSIRAVSTSGNVYITKLTAASDGGRKKMY